MFKLLQMGFIRVLIIVVLLIGLELQLKYFWLEELSILFRSSSYHVQPICTLASVVVNHPTLLFMFFELLGRYSTQILQYQRSRQCMFILELEA